MTSETNRYHMAKAFLINDARTFAHMLNKTSFVSACAAVARDNGPDFDRALDLLSDRTKKRN